MTVPTSETEGDASISNLIEGRFRQLPGVILTLFLAALLVTAVLPGTARATTWDARLCLHIPPGENYDSVNSFTVNVYRIDILGADPHIATLTLPAGLEVGYNCEVFKIGVGENRIKYFELTGTSKSRISAILGGNNDICADELYIQLRKDGVEQMITRFLNGTKLCWGNDFYFSSRRLLYPVYFRDSRDLNYWTPEAKRTATPMILTDDEFTKEGSIHFNTQSIGAPKSFNPDLSQAPFNSAGRLFFVNPKDPKNNKNHSCTAQFVAPNVLMTAAHCLMDNIGNRYERFVFDLGYKNNKSVRSFVGSNKCIFVNDQWSGRVGDTKFDYGFIRVEQDYRGPVIPLIYYRSFPDVTSFGYPGSQKDFVNMKGVYGEVTSESGYLLMNNNPMGMGSSGGAWVVNIDGKYHAVGLNSFSWPDRPNSTFSPYFDDNVRQQLELAKFYFPGKC